MSKVTLAPEYVNDLLAAPLRDQPLANTRLTLLVVLGAAALVLFQALRAIVAALLALLLPALALLRSFLLVVALAGMIGYSLVAGSAEAPAEEPGGTAPSPTSVHAPSKPTPPPEARPVQSTRRR
jgi:hypothetical protein